MAHVLRFAPALLTGLSILFGCASCAQSVLPGTGTDAGEQTARNVGAGLGPAVGTPDGGVPSGSTGGVVPAHRRKGERLPLRSGEDLRRKGLIRVDDTFWMTKTDAEAYGRGWVRRGRTYIRRSNAQACPYGPTEAFRIRTDHVDVRTNLAWADAVAVAKRAEAHVLRFLMTYGDVFNLRLPAAPLPVVVHARRRGFEQRLRTLTTDPVGWGAFYDPGRATVYLSTEPARHGGLPWLADLRHEMTHQILDLARPAWRRKRAFGKGWFWIWEGIALHAETLGDPAGVDSQALRMGRFRTRVQRAQVTPFRRLVALPQANFTGRHYDHTAALMRYLLDPRRPTLRRGTLRCIAELMRGHIPPDRLESLLGARLEDLDRAFLAIHGG